MLSGGVQVSGDLGGEMAQHADNFVSGFIRTFENNYSRFEQAVKQAVWPSADFNNCSAGWIAKGNAHVLDKPPVSATRRRVKSFHVLSAGNALHLLGCCGVC